MGSLRFLLAISVAYGHLGMFMGFPLVPGDTAVQCFFVVSGFYMSMILNGKYAASSYWLFISNRLMRLYPVYLAVLVATLLLTTRVWPNLDPLGWIYFAFSQVAIFAQDVEMFLFVTAKGALVFTSNFNVTRNNLYEYAPLPQAWSLGIELWFYLLAPFILKRSVRFVVALAIASILLRMALQFAFGWSGDPWSYRFFPSELALFLLGAIAHRADRRVLLAMALVIAAVLFVNRPGGIGRAASVSFVAMSAIAIPWLFAVTKDWSWDKFLGELSYPIYVVHLLVGALIANPAVALAVTIAASIALYLFVDRPVDRWRQSRVVEAR